MVCLPIDLAYTHGLPLQLPLQKNIQKTNVPPNEQLALHGQMMSNSLWGKHRSVLAHLMADHHQFAMWKIMESDGKTKNNMCEFCITMGFNHENLMGYH